MDEDQAGLETPHNKKQLVSAGSKLLSSRNSRVSNGWFGFWILTALIADLITLIPFAGDFVAPIFWVVFAVFLYKKGCGIMNPSRLAVELVAWAAKMVPVIQEFPETTIGLIAVILLIRFEDRSGGKNAEAGGENDVDEVTTMENEGPLNQNGVRAASGPKPSPAYVDGVRQPSTDSEVSDGVENDSPYLGQENETDQPTEESPLAA